MTPTTIALRISLAITLLAVAMALPGRAQVADSAAPMDAEKFDKQSAALRTALHYDPSLEAPLKNLAKLYTEAARADELLAIYRTHTTQYPQDESARVVLIRLLREMRKPEAQAMVTRARTDFPQSPLVAYLAFQAFEQEKDPRALDVLSEAISTETQPGRKRLWIDQLVDLAIAEGRGDLASKHLTELAEAPGQSAEFLLAVAGKMHKAKFHDLALATLDKARTINSSPELNIDIELAAAAAEASLAKFAEAGRRLDALLETVAADYWRRPEIVSRRVNLLRTDAARESMLKAARARFAADPDSEAAALDLGELLVACELRRDALAALLEASKSLPNSERLEKAVLALFDRLNDLGGARDYLEGRLERFPDRIDLDYRYVKSLFLSGLRADADARFESLLAKLDQASRADQALDLARYLRRMGLPESAATWFARVVEQAPQRLDVRRELAETYLVLGKRRESRALFSADLADGAEIENFVDVVQFMIQQEILLEAKKAIAKRLGGDQENFELRLMLLDVHGKLGDQFEGERLLESTRLLADTEARYRSWAEAGAKFHELFETLVGFLDAEQARLVDAGGSWTTQRISRLLVFCDIAGRSQERSRVVEVVRAQIAAADTPAALRLELRRLLVRLLDRDPAGIAELEEQLAALEKEDAQRADEYRLRLGKLYTGAQRPDLAAAYLEELDFAKITDSGLLSGLHLSFLDRGEPRKALAVLERIASLEPTNRTNWETWLTFLAAMGEEAELRQAIRRLIIGIDRMPLGEESYALLRGHLVDSYWRSIAHKLASGEDERRGEIFALLDAIERSGGQPDEQLWVLWTRAHVLNLQGRERARDEALAQLQDAAAAIRQGRQARVAEGEPAQPEVMIEFPDGLAVSVEAAVAILREPPLASAAQPATNQVGPLPELRADWAFETDNTAAIVQTLPLPGGDVLVFDRAGTVYRVSGNSGKLIWRTTADEMESAFPPPDPVAPGLAAARLSRAGKYSRQVNAQLPAQGVADADGNFALPFREQVLCLSGADGKPRWVGQMGGEPLPADGITAPLVLAIEADQVLAYNRRTAVAAAFDRLSGKLSWERAILPENGAGEEINYLLTDFCSGASVADGRMLVYGRHAAVIETRHGTTIWSFQASNTRRFPIKLAAPDELAAGGSLAPSLGALLPLPGSQQQQSFAGSSLSANADQRPPTINYLGAPQDPAAFARQGGTLVAPAAGWAESVRSGKVTGMGVLAGNRLLLLGTNVQLLSLDLPLAGAQRNLYRNSFVGTSANKACFLNDQLLSILNLSRNTLAVADLSWVVDSTPLELQVSIAGARVYATGRKGVMCFNLHTGGEIFRSPWPEVVSRFFLSGTDAAAAAEPATTTGSNLWQGRIPRVTGTPSRLQTNPFQRISWGSAVGSAGTPTCFPVHSAVAGGKLYALIAPHQLVALSHGDASPNANPADHAERPD